MASHASLDAAAQERKARLAKLKTLKRKQPTQEPDEAPPTDEAAGDPMEDATHSITKTYLSGRNFDIENHAPKLGFENAPNEGKDTLEKRAEEIETEIRQKAEEDKADEPIDLFKLQPKKPNWDLKRDLEKKLERVNVQTDNAIARLVRERIQAQKKQQVESGAKDEGEQVGVQGEEMVEILREREREDAEDERREREEIENI